MPSNGTDATKPPATAHSKVQLALTTTQASDLLRRANQRTLGKAPPQHAMQQTQQ